MINYAHRGASEYAPENTLSSFYLGLLQGANGIETDVQRTKDGILILFHDDMLERVTNSTGFISDYTFNELKRIKVYGESVSDFYDRIVSLEEFLQRFSGYDINFAIELKSANIEADTVALIKKFGIEDRTTVTSFEYDYIKNVKLYDDTIRIGWLVNSDGVAEIDKLKEIGGEEMAPKAEMLTNESIKKIRDAGIGVRAWGVFNTAIMKKIASLEIDGMTVNFPDRLNRYLTSSPTIAS